MLSILVSLEMPGPELCARKTKCILPVFDFFSCLTDDDWWKGAEIKAEETANRNERNMNECILLYEYTVHDVVGLTSTAAPIYFA